MWCLQLIDRRGSPSVPQTVADRYRSYGKTSFIVYTNCIPYENVTVCALIVAIYMHKVSTCTFVYANVVVRNNPRSSHDYTNTQIETVQTTIMSVWNKRQISNWSSAGYLKTCANLQLVSAPSNPVPIVDHFRRSHPLCELSYWTNVSIGKEKK